MLPVSRNWGRREYEETYLQRMRESEIPVELRKIERDSHSSKGAFFASIRLKQLIDQLEDPREKNWGLNIFFEQNT